MVPIELILFLLLFATAIVVARLKDLFAAAMLTGIFSLVSAGLFTLMDAVDVAFLGHLTNPILFARGIAMDVRHHEVRTVAVFRRLRATLTTRSLNDSVG